MIPDYIQDIIKKYKEGFEPSGKAGRYVKANPIPKYNEFAEYYLKRTRPSTIRIYLNYLHKWCIPISKQNITDFDGSIELLDEKRHEYRTPEHTYTNKNGTVRQTFRNWVPSFVKLNSDRKVNNFYRFQYFMRRVMEMYLIALNEKELLECLPDSKKIKKPRHLIKTGHLTEDEFEQYNNNYTTSSQEFVYNLLAFYTGGRVSELMQMKKNTEWLPFYKPNKPIVIQPGEVFEIKIPEGFAKTHESQSLFLNNLSHIDIVVAYLNKIKHGQYVFKFHPNLNRIKTYLDIEREKSVIRKILNDGLQACGLSHKIKEITIHSLRRSYIHYIYNKYEKDIEFASAAARHTSGIAMTGKYLKTTTAKVKDRFEKTYEK